MEILEIQQLVDQLFGFPSNWTTEQAKGCCELGGTINLDLAEIADLVKDINAQEQADLITMFIAAHEKGHHLQEKVWPDRSYEVEHHEMEIEADLIGAWAVAHLCNNQTVSKDLVSGFDDAYRIAQRLGTSLGDEDPDKPHHPWAEQRELALVRGPGIAATYPNPITEEIRIAFADDMRAVAKGIKCRGL